MNTTGNKRLDAMLALVVETGRGGQFVLDCYMGRCIREDVCHTITTRTATDSNTWVCEVYEDLCNEESGEELWEGGVQRHNSSDDTRNGL